MTDLMNIGMQAGEVIGNQLTAKQQFERQKKLMDLQVQNQMKLNLQGQDIQLDTWEKTNYPAQVEMLKKAGLNPALLYSKGGTGGTTGGQGGGSASSGSASQANPMNIANIIQMKAMEAGIKSQEAQARKANAEAEVIEQYGGGKSQAEIAESGARKGKAEAETENVRIETAINSIEYANTQRQIDARVENTAELTNKLRLENAITQETFNSIVERTKAEAVGAELENDLKNSKINLTESEIKAIKTGIVQKWTELSQKAGGLKIDQFEAEIKAEYPNAGQVIGAIAKKAYKTIQNIENLFKGGAKPITDTVK